jgi:carboxyl-terminal processing protease
MKVLRHLLWILFLLLPGLPIHAQVAETNAEAKQDPYYQAMKNIKLFGQIYQEINDSYIEEIDPEKFIRAGINGMLDRLDPYTVFLEEDGKDELDIITRGKYFGVGMRIQVRNGWATVGEQPFPESPAARAGIREGDQIIEIDGQSTKGMKLSETAHKLRGTQKGSEVILKIRRVGEEQALSFTLLRDEIKVTDIQFSGMIAPGIGMIKLSSFNRQAGEQIQAEIQKLKDQGLEGLILDLRSNPGGLLDAAISVSESFVAKGDMIVFTEGRGEYHRKDYLARKDPILGSLPLVVLVDGYSASSSEIVAGAIQDLDRGVLIGTPTFGKGLVQTVIPLDRRGETQLKITTMQYFTPSGRNIQKPDVFNYGPQSVFLNGTDRSAVEAAAEDGSEDDPDANGDENGPDAKAAEKEKDKAPSKSYFTRNQRLVLGGGGLKPDIEITPDKMSRYELELLRRSMFFNFSLDYVAAHPALDRNFEVDDALLDEFNAFCRQKKFDYKPEGYAEIEKLEKNGKQGGYLPQIEKHLQAIKDEFEVVKERDRLAAKKDLKLALKMEISGKAFGRDQYWKAYFSGDSTVTKGVGLLRNPELYNKVLGNTKEKK